MTDPSPGVLDTGSQKKEADISGMAAVPAPAEGAPYEVSGPGIDEYPIQPYNIGGPLPLPAGFYLMPGVTGQGKSTTSLALKLWIESSGKLEGRACYKYVAEPRSKRVSSIMLPAQWQSLLLTNMIACRRGLFVVDSMTYNLANLPLVMERAEMMSDVTYKGGLSPRDVFAVLLLTGWAVRLQVVLIGTLNTELYPIAGALEGAAEGTLQLLNPGLFKAKSRSAGRYYATYSIPDSYVTQARELLGVSKTGDVDERRDSLSTNLGVLV
jgi:hypothetical protein